MGDRDGLEMGKRHDQHQSKFSSLFFSAKMPALEETKCTKYHLDCACTTQIIL